MKQKREGIGEERGKRKSLLQGQVGWKGCWDGRNRVTAEEISGDDTVWDDGNGRGSSEGETGKNRERSKGQQKMERQGISSNRERIKWKGE